MNAFQQMILNNIQHHGTLKLSARYTKEAFPATIAEIEAYHIDKKGEGLPLGVSERQIGAFCAEHGFEWEPDNNSVRFTKPNPFANHGMTDRQGMISSHRGLTMDVGDVIQTGHGDSGLPVLSRVTQKRSGATIVYVELTPFEAIIYALKRRWFCMAAVFVYEAMANPVAARFPEWVSIW